MKKTCSEIVKMKGDEMKDFPLLEGVKKQVEDPLDIFITMNLKPSLSIIGADGIPPIESAGNVLRTNTDLKISLRTPPGIDATSVAEKVQKLLEENPPNGAHVTAKMTEVADGFLSPKLPDSVSSALEEACNEFYGNSFMDLYIGGTIHELGHGLSLPHNLATKNESIRGTALMGAGNYTYRREWNSKQKGSFLTHSSAIRLLVHPLFNGTSSRAKSSPSLKYKDLSLSFNNGIIQITGKIETGIPAIAMIAYNDRENKGQRGYMVNNNYDATSWTSVLSPTNEFHLAVGDLGNGNHQIRLLSVHMNGATETKRIHYSMKDGMPDLNRASKEIVSILSNND